MRQSAFLMKGYIMAEYLAEGDYLVDVSLEGGSGKADITSPAKMHTSENGEISVEIEWSSPHYDYMMVLDKEYYPINDSGNSRFVIDLDALYEELPVTAETVAMSEPHMIDYTIHFDTHSVERQGRLVYSTTMEAVGAGVLLLLLAAAVGAKLRYRNAKK